MNKENLVIKYLFAFLVVGLLISKLAIAGDTKNNNVMRIKLTFGDKSLIIKLQDNSAFRQLMAQLPAMFRFTDFTGKEKNNQIAQSDFPD